MRETDGFPAWRPVAASRLTGRRAMVLAVALALGPASACGAERSAPRADGAQARPEAPLAGEWTRRSEMNGVDELPVYIGPSSMTFESELDTIFRYTYVRSGDSLHVTALWEDTVSQVAVIRHLGPDSLILEGLTFPAVTRPLRLRRGLPRPR